MRSITCFTAIIVSFLIESCSAPSNQSRPANRAATATATAQELGIDPDQPEKDSTCSTDSTAGDPNSDGSQALMLSDSAITSYFADATDTSTSGDSSNCPSSSATSSATKTSTKKTIGSGTKTNTSISVVITPSTPIPDKIVYDGFFYPAKMKECLDSGKLFDRSTLDCHTTATYTPPSGAFECNTAGVTKAFANSPVVIAELQKRDAAKWLYDQCGLIGQSPIVYFVCFIPIDQSCDTIIACQATKDLDPNKAKICVSRISAAPTP